MTLSLQKRKIDASKSLDACKYAAGRNERLEYFHESVTLCIVNLFAKNDLDEECLRRFHTNDSIIYGPEVFKETVSSKNI